MGQRAGRGRGLAAVARRAAHDVGGLKGEEPKFIHPIRRPLCGRLVCPSHRFLRSIRIIELI